MSDAAPLPSGDEALVTCDACPVLCRIRLGRTGACDRYGNVDGKLARLDPLVIAQPGRRADRRWCRSSERRDWSGELLRDGGPLRHRHRRRHHLPRLQAGPLHRRLRGRRRRHGDGGDRGHLQLLRRQGEDRHRPVLGPETAAVRCEGEQVGHVTTAEYGSQMLSLGGVRHLTGGSKHEGVVTCDTLLTLLQQGAGRAGRRGRRPLEGCRPAQRPSLTARASSACASAAARPRSASSRGSGRATPTR